MRCLRSPRLSAICLPVLLAGCGGVLDPQGPVGDGNKAILINSLVVMLCIVVPTIVGTLGFAWWYREGNRKAVHQPQFAYSGRVELVTWSAPILIVLFLSGIAWIGSHDLDPYKPLPSRAQPLEVQVVSLDWKWLFIYPDQGIATVNTLTVPAGMPVHFTLTSASVMNTFFVPQLGSMIYTMNGMSSQLYLQAHKPGTFHGLSGHFSGDGFPGMHFDVQALPPTAFGQWVDGVRAGNGPELTDAAYRELSRQSLNVAPITYKSAAPGLYDAIVTQAIPPGPGPEVGRGGIGITPTHTIAPHGS